ncbi:MAG: hypothetical protein U9N38_03925 [Thermodesulfobacteriota bacterium]|nr:hypothetical protein [Thermodesulfobacteriota bacterium]
MIKRNLNEIAFASEWGRQMRFITGPRQKLGQAIMQEEDDWLDWKAAQEMLKSWIGVRKEFAD